MSGTSIVPFRKARLILDIYSHHFSVRGFGRVEKDMLLDFCRPYAQFGLKRVGPRKFVKAMLRVYVGVKKDRSEFRFHINTLDDFYRHAANYGVKKEQMEIIEHPLYTPDVVEYEYIDERLPRDYQEPMIEYVVAPGKTKAITLDPGRGKTFIALKAIDILKCKTFFCIKAQYIDKWIPDVHEAFNIKPGELMVIKGSANLKRLIELAVAGELEAKIILCSNATYKLFLKDYEMYGDRILELGWACLPHELFEKLGIGLRVIDEAHEHLHFTYRLDVYSNVPKTLALSGTLFSEDKFINQMMEVMYPPHLRMNEKERVKVVAVEAMMYDIENVDNRVKYMNHSMKSYSHVKFEQSVMKNKALLKSYFNMVADITQKRFVDIREPGQKMVIYFSTKEMCTLAHEFLSKIHPTLNVVRYIGGDDYDEMREGDLVVSTLKSLGTAIDIPGLRVALMTDALGSAQLNVQTIGRLRPLKDWPGTDPEFLFMVCLSIEKHLHYFNNKKELLKGRVKSISVNNTGFIL